MKNLNLVLLISTIMFSFSFQSSAETTLKPTSEFEGRKKQNNITKRDDSELHLEVKKVLQKFQNGYTMRDVKELKNFMELFEDDEKLEVIGTNAVERGQGEWCWGPKATRNLVANDWKSWGDVSLDVDGARIHILGEVAWLATLGTVKMSEDIETSYKKTLNSFKKIQKKQINKEEKILEIIRDGTNTLYEARKGRTYVWPLRFTAVLIKRSDEWRFHQMNFSFPTIRKPDVRLSTSMYEN